MDQSQLKISVIICTRKPREDHLNRVLDALKMQTLPKEQWELLLVSVAADGPLSGRFDLSWHPEARFILEGKIGLTHGRLRGIVEAQAEILAFIDDDNVLRSDYLQAALKIGEDYPWLGAWGGSCIPEFEVEPPPELRPWLGGLLIEKRTETVWAKLRIGGPALPPGAGMVVRRKQAQYYREQVLNDPVRLSLGPHSKPPRGGDDSDLALSGFDLGLGTGMFPELELTHLIPARKLNVQFLETLYESFGYANVLLSIVHDKQQQHVPGHVKFGILRTLLLWIFMFATGKNSAERRIRLALEKGRARASHELRQIGYVRPTSPKL